jgi:uncharacterized membrane protein YidH (DUF202 family)
VRLIAFIEYAAVIAGIAGIIAGRFFGLAKGFDLGVFLVGAGIALGGLESVVTQRMGFRSSEDAGEAYAGAPALIVGFMALLIGIAVIASAYLLAEGLWPRTAGYLARRPAPLLAAAGALAIGAGVLMVLNPRGRSGWVWRLVVYVPRSLLGVLLVGAGIAAIAAGALEWLDPQAFADLARKLPRKLEWPLRI